MSSHVVDISRYRGGEKRIRTVSFGPKTAVGGTPPDVSAENLVKTPLMPLIARPLDASISRTWVKAAKSALDKKSGALPIAVGTRVTLVGVSRDGRFYLANIVGTGEQRWLLSSVERIWVPA